MGATSIAKNFRILKNDFQYFNGQGIDIGWGNDPITPTVRGWDQCDGDAQFMQSVHDNSLDFAYSSHCLEHMRNVEESLYNWTRIIKPNGFLFVVVPDWLLYEHHVWPPRFNDDHKFSFSLDTKLPRNDHYHIPSQLLPALLKLNLRVVETRLEDWNFDYQKLLNQPSLDQSAFALTQIAIIAQKIG